MALLRLRAGSVPAGSRCLSCLWIVSDVLTLVRVHPHEEARAASEHIPSDSRAAPVPSRCATRVASGKRGCPHSLLQRQLRNQPGVCVGQETYHYRHLNLFWVNLLGTTVTIKLSLLIVLSVLSHHGEPIIPACHLSDRRQWPSSAASMSSESLCILPGPIRRLARLFTPVPKAQRGP